MSPVRTLAAAALATAGLVTATQAQQSADDGRFGDPSHFTEPTGAAIYTNVCAGCHMANGRGAQGAGAYPSLAQDPRLAVVAYPIALVLHGHNGMPPFARYLSDVQIAAVVTYIRGNFGNTYADQPTLADVQAIRAAP